MSNNTVESIIANAERLLNDAKILRDAGSFKSATSLAILSIEESGKACIVRWKSDGLITGSVTEALRRCHADKQRVFAIYKFCQAVHETLIPRLIQDFHLLVQNPTHKLAPASEMTELCAKAGHERACKEFFNAEMRIIDYTKEMGFYIDIDENLDVVAPFGELGIEDADGQINRAEDAIKMARADNLLRRTMAAVFREQGAKSRVKPRAALDAAITAAAAKVRSADALRPNLDAHGAEPAVTSVAPRPPGSPAARRGRPTRRASGA